MDNNTLAQIIKDNILGHALEWQMSNDCLKVGKTKYEVLAKDMPQLDKRINAVKLRFYANSLYLSSLEYDVLREALGYEKDKRSDIVKSKIRTQLKKAIDIDTFIFLLKNPPV